VSRITNVSLRHRATVYFLLVVLIIAGVTAYVTLPRESSPDVQIPLIIVYTRYTGASPADIETLITDPVERELQGVEGMKKLTSVSQESASVVVVEFVSGTDIDVARQKVRDRVDMAKVDFPEEAEEPVLQEINFSDFPIVQVNLAGEVGPAVLKGVAERLQDELEAVPGVLRANLIGGLDREVQVNVDPDRLQQYDLSLQDVVAAVANENVAIPGGDLDLGDQTFAVRVPGDVDNPRQVADFVVSARQGKPVFLRDLGTVRYGFKDRESYARINGKESVALTVQKRQGANIIEVVDAVKAKVAESRPSWPGGVTATILADQSKDIRSMVSDLENNILSGLVLVVLVLLLAMGFRPALFVGLAIPFSMLLTFLVLQLTGITLNMVVLFSLVLAVGMLVDNGVVVVENIYRHMQEGTAAFKAASEATHEVDSAIFVSTLTTLAAFTPLLFWPGVVGDFMVYLPITVSIALAASLLVAFTANPVLCASFLRPAPAATLAERGLASTGWRAAFGKRIMSAYRGSLAWALEHRKTTIAAALGTFFGSFLLFGLFNTGVEFFPETEPRQIFADVDMPAGTRLEATDQTLRTLEGRLQGLPDLKVMAASTGAGSQAEFGGIAQGGDANRGRIAIDLLDREERSQNSFDTMEQARRDTAGLPGATVKVDRPNEGPPVGKPVNIEISGADFTTLGSIAARVRKTIEDIPGLVSLDDDFDLAKPEIVVAVDRTQAARLGLTTSMIASTVRTAIAGTEASTWRKARSKEKVYIRVRLEEADRQSIDTLAQLRIRTMTGGLVPLTSVATLNREAALTAIRHTGQKRVVTVTGDVTSPRYAGPVRAEAEKRLAAIPDLLPAGYRMTFTGQNEDEDEAKSFLTKAFLYALLLVLALMVAQFDSVTIPLIVMTSVLMSMMGVLVGLVVTRLPFGIIMTGIGVISLAGVVVNNAIVLLDYAQQLRARGLPRQEVVMLTGMRRFRPVMLTAVTTILGLIPLSTGFEFDFHTLTFATGGESSQWWRGMGVAVIFGLAMATFLTLIVVPVLYDLLVEWQDRRKGKGRTRHEITRDPLAELEREEGVVVG